MYTPSNTDQKFRYWYIGYRQNTITKNMAGNTVKCNSTKNILVCGCSVFEHTSFDWRWKMWYTGLGGKGGEILGAPLKTLGEKILCLDYFSKFMEIPTLDTNFAWLKMVRIGDAFSSLEKQCFLFLEKVSNNIIDSFIKYAVVQFHSNIEKVRNFSRIVAPSWNWDTEAFSDKNPSAIEHAAYGPQF